MLKRWVLGSKNSKKGTKCAYLIQTRATKTVDLLISAIKPGYFILYFHSPIMQLHSWPLLSKKKKTRNGLTLEAWVQISEKPNFEDWHHLMSYVKWWIFLVIIRPCLLIYSTFESHFNPLRLCKIGMAHLVSQPLLALEKLKTFIDNIDC